MMGRTGPETLIQPDGGLLSVLGDVLFASVILVMIYPFYKRTVGQMNRQFFSQAFYTFQVLMAVGLLGFGLMLLVAQQMRVTYCSLVRPYVGDTHSDKAFILLKLMVCFLLVFNYFLASYLQRAVASFLVWYQSGKWKFDAHLQAPVSHARSTVTKATRRDRGGPHLYSTRDAFVNNINTNSQTPVTQTQTVMRSDILGCMSNSTLSTESYYKMRSNMSQSEQLFRDVGTMVRFPEFPGSQSSTFSLHLDRGVGFAAEPRDSSSLACTTSFSNCWRNSSSTTTIQPSSGNSSMGFSTGVPSSYFAGGIATNPAVLSASSFLSRVAVNTGFHNSDPENNDEPSDLPSDNRRYSNMPPPAGMENRRGTMQAPSGMAMDNRRGTMQAPSGMGLEGRRGTMQGSVQGGMDRRGTMQTPNESDMGMDAGSRRGTMQAPNPSDMGMDRRGTMQAIPSGMVMDSRRGTMQGSFHSGMDNRRGTLQAVPSGMGMDMGSRRGTMQGGMDMDNRRVTMQGSVHGSMEDNRRMSMDPTMDQNMDNRRQSMMPVNDDPEYPAMNGQYDNQGSRMNGQYDSQMGMNAPAMNASAMNAPAMNAPAMNAPANASQGSRRGSMEAGGRRSNVMQPMETNAPPPGNVFTYNLETRTVPIAPGVIQSSSRLEITSSGSNCRCDSFTPAPCYTNQRNNSPCNPAPPCYPVPCKPCLPQTCNQPPCSSGPCYPCGPTSFGQGRRNTQFSDNTGAMMPHCSTSPSCGQVSMAQDTPTQNTFQYHHNFTNTYPCTSYGSNVPSCSLPSEMTRSCPYLLHNGGCQTCGAGPGAAPFGFNYPVCQDRSRTVSSCSSCSHHEPCRSCKHKSKSPKGHKRSSSKGKGKGKPSKPHSSHCSCCSGNTPASSASHSPMCMSTTNSCTHCPHCCTVKSCNTCTQHQAHSSGKGGSSTRKPCCGRECCQAAAPAKTTCCAGKPSASCQGKKSPCCLGSTKTSKSNKLCLKQPACPGTFVQQLNLCPAVTRLLGNTGLPNTTNKKGCPSGKSSPCHPLSRPCAPCTPCRPCTPSPRCSSAPGGGCRCNQSRNQNCICKTKASLPVLPKCTRSGKIYGWG